MGITTIIVIGIDVGEGPDGAIGMRAHAESMIRIAPPSGQRGQLGIPAATFI